MKKINILFTLLLVFISSSCDMDKKPYGVLEEDEAIQTLSDCRSYRNGLYVSMRGITTGGFVLYGDIQTDGYHAVIGNGGALNALYSGSLQPEMEEFEAVWGGLYATIGATNFIIGKMEIIDNSNMYSGNDKKELRRYLGEAFFMRAFCYFNLADKFCGAYNKNTATKSNGGLPLSVVYEPTNENDKYPGRSTLAETYDLIKKDLDAALPYLLDYETLANAAPAAKSPYITSYAVKALQARVALVMEDYTEALKKSEEVIGSGKYSLAGDTQKLLDLWKYDVADEAIWRVSMTNQHLGYASGSYFLSNVNNPSFIPTKATSDLFDKDKDYRTGSYLVKRNISLAEGSGEIYAFSKYPGNPQLFVSSNNYTNMSKPFRLAEQYLIAAEAAAYLGYSSKANQHLNTLKSKRISGYVSQQHNGESLINKIREERQRELLGEGFRLGDLKRWGIGFNRSEGQNDILINKLGNVHRLSYEPNDYRLVWPIPKAEMDANPQIRNHQNPGY
ncbi:MAG: RagB/SusD family nutrient uptake outer membrane protein [Dysgonomonas sp.]|nr:RagB/SusD family nutrient uptake outer membrane protein [Dysgonomonas sp.]